MLSSVIFDYYCRLCLSSSVLYSILVGVGGVGGVGEYV